MPIYIASFLNPLVQFMFQQAKQRGISDSKICTKAGLGQGTLSGWSRGREPSLGNFEASLNVLGFRLAIVRKGEKNEPLCRD